MEPKGERLKATRFYSVQRNAFKTSFREQSQEVVSRLREFSSRDRPPHPPPPGPARPGRESAPRVVAPGSGVAGGGGDPEPVCACWRLQLRFGVSLGSAAGRGGAGRGAGAVLAGGWERGKGRSMLAAVGGPLRLGLGRIFRRAPGAQAEAARRAITPPRPRGLSRSCSSRAPSGSGPQGPGEP